MILDYIIKKDDIGKDVKFILKRKLLISERLIRKLKNLNKIFLNNVPVFTNVTVQLSDKIIVDLSYEEFSEAIIPQESYLSILYEDDFIIALDKPAGIIVHPTFNHQNNTLSNYLYFYFLKNKIHKKIRPINRLDKDTTGIVLFAKNEYIQEHLIKQMISKSFYKEYIAVLHNKISPSNGTIDAKISRESTSIIKRCISDSGADAITHYTTISSNDSFSYVKIFLETGRTHQIRVHTNFKNTPIVGDSLYFKDSPHLISRQALHSTMVKFSHPVTSKRIVICSEIPNDIKILIDKVL